MSPNIWVLQPPADISQMFSTVQSVFLAMSLYPDVQRRAQAELDAVVGPNRLPDFEDRDTLVYINALIRETLRWQIMLPFAIPHMTVEDDEFRGRFIPAGTNILPNVWYALVFMPSFRFLILLQGHYARPQRLSGSGGVPARTFHSRRKARLQHSTRPCKIQLRLRKEVSAWSLLLFSAPLVFLHQPNGGTYVGRAQVDTSR